MTDRSSFEFRSLAGITPGKTLVREVRDRLGDPETEYLTVAYQAAGGDAGGDLGWEFNTLGIKVFIHRDDIERADATIDEVSITAPFDETLTCGLYVGQPLDFARNIIRQNFEVKDEYEDSIYFVPNSDDNMLACVENLTSDKVLNIELMNRDSD